jgi:hypothetical protein
MIEKFEGELIVNSRGNIQRPKSFQGEMAFF